MAGIFSNDYIRAMLSATPTSQTVSAVPQVFAAPAAAPFTEVLSAESQKFFAAWRAWRGTRLLPRRQDVQLTAIARLMPQLAVLEVHGPDRAIFRLAGTEIEQHFGARLTGRNFIKLAHNDAKGADATGSDAERLADQAPPSVSVGERLWRQVSQPCAAVMRQDLEYRSGRREAVEIAAAPVLPDIEGAPVQVFAVIGRLSRTVAGPAVARGDAVIRNYGSNLRFLDIGAGIPAKD